jgi:ferredoxin-NADP reductase
MHNQAERGADGGLALRVVGIEYGGIQTNLYRFARADGGTLPAAAAGSHVTLNLSSGISRQYSLIVPGDAPTDYLIGVKREEQGRGGSAFIHDQFRVGDIVDVLPPQNNFPLDEGTGPALLIGGGIGVTPIIAMATRLQELGRSYDMFAAFRSDHHAILTGLLDKIPDVTVHLDEATGAFFPMAETVAAAPRDAHLYCCGPSPMIEKFLECARMDGRDENLVHVEFFAANDEAATEGNFVVELAQSGLSLEIPPGKSILEAVRDAGVSVPSSCEQGVCAACETKVLEGVPDHRDAVLSASERKAGKSMMICCSGSLSKRLVLDL